MLKLKCITVAESVTHCYRPFRLGLLFQRRRNVIDRAETGSLRSPQNDLVYLEQYTGGDACPNR